MTNFTSSHTPVSYFTKPLSKSNLNIAHLNARSLLSIIDDVHLLLYNEHIDILGISETWLDETIADDEICPPHYSIIRRDQNRRGGGVAILLSDRVHYLPCSDINTGNIESVWIELFPNSCH